MMAAFCNNGKSYKTNYNYSYVYTIHPSDY